MAKIDVIMPQMGESIAEGTLSRWMKKVGEAVKRDEPIFEISTDKVDAEIPSPVAGVLAEILVTEGQTVAVQTVVATIETDAAAPATTPSAPAPSAPPAPPRRGAAAGPAARPPRRRRGRPRRRPRPAPRHGRRRGYRPRARRRGRRQRRGESAEERLRRKSTPLVRKMAAEHNLDLERHSRDRPRRPGHQERHPELHRGGAGHGPGSAAPAVAPATRPGAGGRRALHVRARRRAGRRGVARRPGRALVADPEAHGRAHGDVAAGLAAREHDLRDRLHAGGPDPRQGEEGIRRARREPDVPGVHREGRGGRAPQAPQRQLRRERREHRLPARHQPRHRRGARLGTHRPGHQARRRAVAARASPAPSTTWASAPAPRS